MATGIWEQLSMQRAPAINRQRFDELDSLRGVAATMVVLNHFFLATNSTGSREDLLRILVDPLQNGPAAVTLFFLLSGFVLSLPVWRGKPQSYSVFIVRRICRIYVPYLFGLALSVLGASIFVSQTVPGLSQWFYATWNGHINWTLVLKHILFIGPSYNAREFNAAFWTLIIEMRVSIILPFFLLLLRRLSFGGMWLVCAITLIIGLVSEPRFISGFSALQIFGWTGLFIAGAIVARAVILESSHISRIFSRRPVALLSLTTFLFAGYLRPSLPLSEFLTRGLCAGGGLATICVAIYNRDFRNFLNTRVLQFMGRVSYSLYLLHATVLYVMFHLFYGLFSKVIIFVLYISASFLLAAISYKLVERPSIELGRRLTQEQRTLVPVA
jgi:peptidoglycan/LPS O-acetylase OafA/YrhL